MTISQLRDSLNGLPGEWPVILGERPVRQVVCRCGWPLWVYDEAERAVTAAQPVPPEAPEYLLLTAGEPVP